MEIFGNTLALSSLLMLVYQDMRYRSVSWSLLLFLSTGLLISGINEGLIPKYALLNLSFLMIQLLALSIWSRLRLGSFLAFINQALGLGDILFFLALCLAFSPVNYIIFYLFALVVSLLIFLAWIFIKRLKPAETEFPLISGMGMVLIAVLCLKMSGAFDQYTDISISHFINL